MTHWTDELSDHNLKILTKTVTACDWCDYRLTKFKHEGKWTNAGLEYNDFKGTGNNEWADVELFEHFSKGDIEYLKKEFGMDFELPYGNTEEELIDTNELVNFKENNHDTTSKRI